MEMQSRLRISLSRLRRLPRWRKIKLTQTAFAAVILVALIAAPVYYSLPAKSESKITAVKLQITINPISEDQIAAIVSAVDESGRLDTTRDDVVELSFKGTTASELERSRVTLKNGEASVNIKVHLQQSSFLTATWVNGPTPLKETTVLVSPLMWNY
jgi:hypothetical protein